MNRDTKLLALRRSIASGLCALLLCGAEMALSDPLLKLPDFEALERQASESVTIALDPTLLGLAARFLDANDPADAAVREAMAGIKGIYVRSYTFDDDFAYRPSDIDAVRKQLTAPGWQRVVEVRSRRQRADVDIYVSLRANQANGLAIIAREPRQFTIVNIVGSIDLDKLHKLEGRFGVPELELQSGRKPAK